jgi:hypothetical protein
MNNRKKIEKTINKMGLKLISCEFVRNQEASFGGVMDASHWEVTISNGNKTETFDSYHGLSIAEDVDEMLDEIKEEFELDHENTISPNPTTKKN